MIRSLGLLRKKNQEASIDESYPDYIIGSVGTVQRELWVFYAPASEVKHDKNKMAIAVQAFGQLAGPRAGVFYGDYVYAVTDVGASKYQSGTHDA